MYTLTLTLTQVYLQSNRGTCHMSVATNKESISIFQLRQTTISCMYAVFSCIYAMFSCIYAVFIMYVCSFFVHLCRFQNLVYLGWFLKRLYTSFSPCIGVYICVSMYPCMYAALAQYLPLYVLPFS